MQNLQNQLSSCSSLTQVKINSAQEEINIHK